jgi:hypothetical protein
MPSANANPGSQSDGSILLPNGWRVAPAGKMLAVGTLPLNLVTSPDGRYAIITNNGIAKPSFSIVDLANWTVKNTVPVENAFLGLAWSADGSKLYSSGGGLNNVQEFSYIDGTLTRARTMALPAKPGESLAGGVAMSRDGRTLYATRVFAMTLSSIDVASGQVSKTIALPAEPYTCIVSPDGRTVYVSLWGDRQVRGYSTESLTETMVFRTGEHPSAMAISADGRRLFVASANGGNVIAPSAANLEHLDHVVTECAANLDAERAGVVARRQQAAGRGFGLERDCSGRYQQFGAQLRRRVYSHRVVSDRRRILARRQTNPDFERQRDDAIGQSPDWRIGKTPGRAAIDGANARPRHAGRHESPRDVVDAVQRHHPAETLEYPDRLADSPGGWRQLAVQACDLCDPRKPHLRPDSW